MKNISVAELKNKIHAKEDFVLIDVRTEEEKAEGLIENSLRIDIMQDVFPAKIMDLDKSKTYYVYCKSGGRSASACQFMEKQGLDATNVTGGIMAWNQI
jgi:rhodanese-related sulfurtransferase